LDVCFSEPHIAIAVGEIDHEQPVIVDTGSIVDLADAVEGDRRFYRIFLHFFARRKCEQATRDNEKID
jgi:hypothetical protein